MVTRKCPPPHIALLKLLTVKSADSDVCDIFMGVFVAPRE